MTIVRNDGTPVDLADFNQRQGGYHVLSHRPPICPGCHRPHPVRQSHVGDVSEWAYEQVNLQPYRDLDWECYSFLDSVASKDWRGRWSDLVALTIYQKPVSRFHWLQEGENLIHEDSTILIGPASCRLSLETGVAFHVTPDRRNKVEAKADLAAPGEELMVLAGFTGLWVRVLYPLGNDLWNWKYFKTRGQELEAKMARNRKAAIMQNMRNST